MKPAASPSNSSVPWLTESGKATRFASSEFRRHCCVRSSASLFLRLRQLGYMSSLLSSLLPCLYPQHPSSHPPSYLQTSDRCHPASSSSFHAHPYRLPAMYKAPLLTVFIGFALLLASLVLQALNSVSLPFLKVLPFLTATSVAGNTLSFGVWSICARIAPLATFSCTPGSLGYMGSSSQQLVNSVFSSGLPSALILQPIAAGLTALATVGALLNLCGFTIFWVLLAIVSAVATIVCLALELAIFVPAVQSFKNGSYSVDGANALFGTSVVGPGGASAGSGADFSKVSSAMLGPSTYMQIGATVASILGAAFITIAFVKERKQRTKDKNVEFDFQPTDGAHNAPVNRGSFWGGGQANGGQGQYNDAANLQSPEVNGAAANGAPNGGGGFMNRLSKRWTYAQADAGNGYDQPGAQGAYYDDDGYYVPDGGQGYTDAHGQYQEPPSQSHSPAPPPPQQFQQHQNLVQQVDQQSQGHSHQTHYTTASGSHHKHTNSAGSHSYYAQGAQAPPLPQNTAQAQGPQTIITPGPAPSGAPAGRPRWSQEGAY